jgi:tetratricopeptide repeat protein 8
MLSDDTNASDIWYNISHVAIGSGDLNLAYQALKICISYNGEHFEAFNNLGVLEMKKEGIEQARSNFLQSCKNTDYSYEPYYNYAVTRYKQGDLEESFKFTDKALEIYPSHYESKELKERIHKQLLG